MTFSSMIITIPAKRFTPLRSIIDQLGYTSTTPLDPLLHYCAPFLRLLGGLAFQQWLFDCGHVHAHKMPTNNTIAKFLHYLTTETPNLREVFTSSFKEGWPPVGYPIGIGSVFLVRQGRKPLSIEHVEVLTPFCRDMVSPLLSRAYGMHGQDKKIDNAILDQRITKGKFGEFFDAWRACQEDEKKRMLPSPYGMDQPKTEHI